MVKNNKVPKASNIIYSTFFDEVFWYKVVSIFSLMRLNNKTQDTSIISTDLHIFEKKSLEYIWPKCKKTEELFVPGLLKRNKRQIALTKKKKNINNL